MNVSRYVERAMTAWPDTRDSDRKLILAVWWLQDNDYDSHFKAFFKEKAIMPESITRCRRKLQEEGRYLASQQAVEDRFNKFQQMREVAPRTHNVDDVMDILN